MLEDEAGDVGIVARQHQLCEHAGHACHRTQQHLQHVDIVDADLQHDAARHAGGLVTPRGEVELAEPVAADIAFRLHQLAEAAGVDLGLDPAEMAFPPALIAERENDTGLLADARDLDAFGDRVGDRLVEEDVLAGRGGEAGGLEMRVVGRGVDDRLDRIVLEDLIVARRRPAAVFCREGAALVFGAGEAGDDLDLGRALGGVGQHVRPPAHAQRRDPQRT